MPMNPPPPRPPVISRVPSVSPIRRLRARVVLFICSLFAITAGVAWAFNYQMVDGNPGGSPAASGWPQKQLSAQRLGERHLTHHRRGHQLRPGEHQRRLRPVGHFHRDGREAGRHVHRRGLHRRRRRARGGRGHHVPLLRLRGRHRPGAGLQSEGIGHRLTAGHLPGHHHQHPVSGNVSRNISTPHAAARL